MKKSKPVEVSIEPPMPRRSVLENYLPVAVLTNDVTSICSDMRLYKAIKCRITRKTPDSATLHL